MAVERETRFPVADCTVKPHGHGDEVESGKHLLVDGSNVLHAWPELRALAGRDRITAQGQLIGALAALHDHEGVRLTVVFDGSGTELEISCPGGRASFAMVRTPTGMTADDFIERWVGRAASPGACWVATADRAEIRTVEALGAQSLLPEDLASWCRRAGGRLDAKLAGRKRENDREWSGKV